LATCTLKQAFLREVCNVLGIKIHAKDYTFTVEEKKDFKYAHMPV